MDLKLIARRYIEAFADYAGRTIGLKQAITEFKALQKIIRDNHEFKDILTSPAVSDSQKREFIDNILEKHFSQELNQFLKLLIEKRRIQLLGEMVDYFLNIYSPKETIDVVLKSAHPLDKAVIKTVEEKLKKRLNKKPELSVEVDAGLIGGLRLEIGSTVIDGSVRAGLEALKEELIKTKVG